MLERINNYITPVRLFSILAIILGIMNHLTTPLEHASNFSPVTLFGTNIYIEVVVRIMFIFCGVYGLLGNGNTKRIRSTVLSVPFLYLGIYYLMSFIKYDLFVLAIPLLLSLTIGARLVFLGDR